ncbi:hypothetical protein TNCV_1980621 [Trichonephila clavipes]|nr:hypothetical protein TNCV_1980621 [Trichonephila clavipes]
MFRSESQTEKKTSSLGRGIGADSDEKCLNGKADSKCFVSKAYVKIRLPWIVSYRYKVALDVARLIPHPEYQHSCKVHDIALIELKKVFKCDFYTLPLCIPQKNYTKERSRIITTGWGTITADGTGEYFSLHIK